MIKVMKYFFWKLQRGACITHAHSRFLSYYALRQSLGAKVLRTGGKIGV